MSGTFDPNETATNVDAPNDGGESSGAAQRGPDDQHECPKSPCTNAVPNLSDKGKQPAAMPVSTIQQSDGRIDNLVDLFREFLETVPNKVVSDSSHPDTQQNAAGRKRFFGLAKGFASETSSNKYDYEQKYPRDEPGKETGENARIWLTYLDEAESFDRERAERWKDTVDVLLVFAGLFSAVITTFISQASQSLQKDNTQVSASLLSEAVQLLRANFTGVPASQVPSSTLTPTSPFIPSTNTLLVNGLWFASLAITLSTALFAVIAKQWLHYYLSSISGSVNERVRARQLRFNGFESWKVPVIIDILPILLHLAVGLFLAGNIILLFPLDVRVAWTILIITSITYMLYFISVMLPIWYAECPYTSSLTIYTGFIFLVLQQVYRNIITIPNGGFQALSRKIRIKARHTIESLIHYLQGIVQPKLMFISKLAVGRLVHYLRGLVQHGFVFISKLAGLVRHGSQRLRHNLPELTKWREENIKKVVKNAGFLDVDSVCWLHATSSNQSIHRIIARSVAVHPFISKRFDKNVLVNLRRTLEINETNVVDLRYGLCLDLAAGVPQSWKLLRSIPDVLHSQLEEGEYQTNLRIEFIGLYIHQRPQILRAAVMADLRLPLTMWSHLFERTSPDTTEAMHTLTCASRGVFDWKFNPTHQPISNAGLVRFNSEELGWWKFERLFRYFKLGNPDYSSDAKTYETRYLLLITIYRNLTSDDPLITDKARRQKALQNVLIGFTWCAEPSKLLYVSKNAEYCFTFFKDIICVDSFWSEFMTDDARKSAQQCLRNIFYCVNTPLDNHLTFADGHNLSLIYKWFSQDFDPDFSSFTPPLFWLLLVPRNRHHLSKTLLDDPDAVSHISKCLYNLANVRFTYPNTSIFEGSINLFKSVTPRNPLFTILYDPSVLVTLWLVLVFCNWDTKAYFQIVKSKISKKKLDELFDLMKGIAESDDPAPLAPELRSLGERVNRARPALKTSVSEFGELKAENAGSDMVNDTEDHAHATDLKTPHSISNRMKKVFAFIRPKTSVKPTDQSTNV